MRLGGRIFEKTADPDAWTAAVKRAGHRAADCPLQPGADDATISAYAKAAAAADILIAEVGAWSNPISPDDDLRRGAIKKCKVALALADRLGARCCVNIAGSRARRWDGPHPDNLSSATFDLVVETVREIIDAVHPTRTFYTLETMPWVFPDSADSYVRLIEAIDRDRFAVHLDPANLIWSPERFFGNAAVLRECFAKLGPRIKSCHAKDVALREKMTVHLDEVRPGTGGLDYRVYLEELSRLDPDVPLMIEHLPTAEEYAKAAAHIRAVAAGAGLSFR